MAHIERYEATRNSLDFVEELADMGVYMRSMQTASQEKTDFLLNGTVIKS